jgi:hypothetical protein
MIGEIGREREEMRENNYFLLFGCLDKISSKKENKERHY